MLQNIAAATNSLPCLLCQQADQLISGASLDSDGMFRCYVRWPSHRLSVHDHSFKKNTQVEACIRNGAIDDEAGAGLEL